MASICQKASRAPGLLRRDRALCPSLFTSFVEKGMPFIKPKTNPVTDAISFIKKEISQLF